MSLSLLFNLPYALFRVQQQAYDTYTHIFFADHYQRAWWEVWEPRWYLGFSVTSYPPLTHQLIALLGWPLTALIKFFAYTPEPYPGAWQWAGLEAAYGVVLLTALALFPLGVRALARVWVGPHAANLAGMCAVFLPALSMSAWAFGQLPTVAATSVLLFALARGAAFVRAGRRLNLLQAVLLAGVAAALHHAVFLLVPFAGFAVVFAHRPTRAQISHYWKPFFSTKAHEETRRKAFNFVFLRVPSWMKFLFPIRSIVRVAVWASLSAASVALVLWPFLWWSRGQSLQTAIDHASRHNFFTDPTARDVFFWPMYGPLLLLVPLMLRLGWRKRLGAWLSACALLVVLGLGGTTPLPALLFGAGWEWLTYDRFSFWAATLMLPLAGVWLARWRHARRARWWLALCVGWAGVAGWSSVLTHAQPPALDLTPLVYFLNEPAQQPYRYLTLGFGDQFAKLSALTTNGSPDGNYHTARALPELQTSGLGALDTTVWNPRGVQALTPFLAHPEKYGLRWVFVNHPAYAAVLLENDWRYRFHVGLVQAWERADVLPLTVAAPHSSWMIAGWWGSAPLSVLFLALVALVALAAPLAPVTRASMIALLSSARRVGWSLTVILLVLWWFHPLYTQPHPNIYFIYRSGLLFACDGMLALSLGVWAIERALMRAPLAFGPRAVAVGGGALIMACVLSALTAQNTVVAWAFTAHLLLLAGFYLALINDAPSALNLGRVLTVVLVALALLALKQTLEQRTAALDAPWPGTLTPAMRGASVVQDAAGIRWLRAYGTLPHPNILGGVLVVGLGAVWVSVRNHRALAVLAALGWLALWLTFSRGAWLGAAAMLGLLWFRPRTRARWHIFALTGISTFALVAALLWPFMVARSTTGEAVPLEQRSVNERVALLQASLRLSLQHPWMGVGAGNFVLALDALHLPRVPWEPVHNVPLLIFAETGGLGLAAALMLVGASAWRAWARRNVADTIEWGWLAVLIGLATLALFDHYWWTMPPMRMLGVLVLALWVSAGLSAWEGFASPTGRG